MPIYEYKCPNGHLFEVFHGMSEPAPDACEVCGAGPLVRVLHPVAVHYKGSGFYTTDYGRKSKAGKDGGGSDAAGGGGSGGAESGSGSASAEGGAGSSSGSSDGGEKKKAAEA
jgi:putative FmdB family regulatory protein